MSKKTTALLLSLGIMLSITGCTSTVSESSVNESSTVESSQAETLSKDESLNQESSKQESSENESSEKTSSQQESSQAESSEQVSSNTESKKLENSLEESENTQKSNHYFAGMYKVGSDIPSGEYILYSNEGTDGSLYFCVSSDSNQDNIIFNDSTKNNSIITVQDGEYLELSRCYAIPFTGNEEVDIGGEYFMVKVGANFQEGEYKIEATEDRGYYCIYSDSRESEILSNDNFEGSTYVTVKNGDYFLVSRAKIVN